MYWHWRVKFESKIILSFPPINSRIVIIVTSLRQKLHGLVCSISEQKPHINQHVQLYKLKVYRSSNSLVHFFKLINSRWKHKQLIHHCIVKAFQIFSFKDKYDKNQWWKKENYLEIICCVKPPMITWQIYRFDKFFYDRWISFAAEF